MVAPTPHLAPSADTDRLREALAESFQSLGFSRSDAEVRAAILLSGPLAPLLAAITAERTRTEEAEAERDRARQERMPHMCRDDHPEIRHAVSGDDERCPVCRERDRADAAEAQTDAVLRLLEPSGPRPCDCTRCDCGNVGDAAHVTSWDAQRDLYEAARALTSTKGASDEA